MPFVANTPESLLGRSDSKNPASTCRGITSSGRPCRRALAQPATLHPTSRPRTPNLHDEALYCWQHKEQANRSARSSPGPRIHGTPILEERTSIDTLADRLGLMDIQEKPGRKKPRPVVESAGRRPSGKMSRPSKPASRLSCCFCFEIPLEEVQQARPARPQPRPVQQTAPVPPKRPSKQQLSASQQRLTASSAQSSPSKASSRSRKSTASQTARLKDLIPDTLDMTTASALMNELSRPHVDSEEPGFIYMFWLTQPSSNTPPLAAARSLLAPPTPSRSRRPSDTLSRVTATSTPNSGTMLLKIGRAANVQRRMNQWQRQCGYDIEVLRYYPYLPGSEESSGVVPHMTPHAHRVERLVHIELAGRGLRAKRGGCEACGREHREWFEVEATREGIRTVDEVVRRWVEWDEAR